MQFWPRDVFDRTPIEEDRQFLTLMMGHRGAAMAGADEIFGTKVPTFQQAVFYWNSMRITPAAGWTRASSTRGQ